MVGVGFFQNDLNAVDFVEEDVNGVFKVLSDHLFVPFENITKLTNKDATRDAIEKAVDAIRGNVREGDRVFLYFSTHGKTFEGTSFLAAYDASTSNNNGWIWLSNLVTHLHNAKCNVLAFLDACHSTQFARSHWAGAELKPITPHNDEVGQYKVVFGAAGENEEAYSDSFFNHGCWTYYLLEALSGKDPRAFEIGSRRITAFSLQNYLYESVRARQHEQNRTQTPYIDAVCPKDILIVDHSEMEEHRLKIRDIYFGKIDTDSEKRNAPSPEFMIKNFYDLNSICGKLAANNGIQVIIGNKGTGKTYLGEFLEASNDRMTYQSVGTITLADLQKITYTTEDARGKYVQAWTYIIYTILACIIVREKKPGYESFHAFLGEIYNNRFDTILQPFPAAKSTLISKRIKNGIRLSDAYSDFIDETGNVSIDDLISIYTYLFNSHYQSDKLYFLVDGLDERIRGELTDKQKGFLLDLLEMVEESHQVLNSIRVVLLFRNDLLRKLSGEANINKIISARSCSLSWLSNNTSYTETPLYRFMEQRIATSAELNGKSSNISLKEILPQQMQGGDTWEWILSFTTYTPRDIVSFFDYCKEYAGDQFCFTASNLWDATRPYSDYLWNEFQDVLAGSVLAGYGDHLLNLLIKLVERCNLSSNTRFSYSDFVGVYGESSELRSIPISEALKVLYEAGMMSVRTNTGLYWYFRENPMPFDHEIWKESTFELHKGIWKKVHIW